MPVIDFLRHGETEAHGLLLGGRTDEPLSEVGWRQFGHQTGDRDFGLIVASPLRRAAEPAGQLALARALDVRLDPDWAELDFGEWDGCPLDELRADPAIAARLDALYKSANAPGPPGGESWRALLDRVGRALERLASDSPAGSVLVVTHAGPIRAAIALACNIPFERLWALRIVHGTRVTLRLEREREGCLRPWGEIIEIAQP